MRKDRRDVLTAEDVQLAAKHLRHAEMQLIGHGAKYMQKNEQIVREDRTFASPE